MGFRERKWEVAGGGGRCSESAREGREARLEESREVEAKMAAVLPPGSGGLREDNRRRGWVGWSREEKGAVAEAGRSNKVEEIKKKDGGRADETGCNGGNGWKRMVEMAAVDER
ncbi:hypothetical protein AMTR_s00004p00228090 [Amborella trichopoda]|uniref:Uncharacterized protein n=1 Tax=Amborella trichopoda TaxID=13333 RepID=W1NF12_AMBTC|nr:hypothetical protein AMTR_s00004p00228090 [Amborella trichopoda]